MPFYTFNQNNSGGFFDFSAGGLTHFVIIEAHNADEANDKLESLGAIFDEGCPCCGDRWNRVDDPYYAKDEPKVYDQPITSFVPICYFMDPNPEGVVHYADGRMEWFGKEGEEGEEKSLDDYI